MRARACAHEHAHMRTMFQSDASSAGRSVCLAGAGSACARTKSRSRQVRRIGSQRRFGGREGGRKSVLALFRRSANVEPIFGDIRDLFGWKRARFLHSSTRPTSGQHSLTFELDARTDFVRVRCVLGEARAPRASQKQPNLVIWNRTLCPASPRAAHRATPAAQRWAR